MKPPPNLPQGKEKGSLLLPLVITLVHVEGNTVDYTGSTTGTFAGGAWQYTISRSGTSDLKATLKPSSNSLAAASPEK